MIVTTIINVVRSWPVAKAVFVAGTAVSATAAGVVTGKIYSGNRKRITAVENKVRMIYSDLYEDSTSESYTEDDSNDSGDIVDLGYAPTREDVDAAT